jgi:hypothetical protein
MVEQNKREEWLKELQKLGLTEEIFENIIAAAPSREIIPGYPQDWVQAISIQENW